MGLYEEGVRTSIFHQKELLVSPLNEHLLVLNSLPLLLL